MNLGVLVQEYVRGAIRDPRQFLERASARTCSVCGYEGRFLAVGPRPQTRCPNCSSKERDRIMGLFLDREGITMQGRALLHFSPERPFHRRWKNLPGYVAGDVKKNHLANAIVDITNIQFPDGQFDYIICHHVLEHVVDDDVGMRECFRVLKPDGTAFFSVPIDVERAETWEPPPGMPAGEIERICGRYHVRLYGLDFADKLSRAGFEVGLVAFSPEDGRKYRLTESHGERLQGLDRIYVCRKP